jgi:hypothetical protein
MVTLFGRKNAIDSALLLSDPVPISDTTGAVIAIFCGAYIERPIAGVGRSSVLFFKKLTPLRCALISVVERKSNDRTREKEVKRRTKLLRR